MADIAVLKLGDRYLSGWRKGGLFGRRPTFSWTTDIEEAKVFLGRVYPDTDWWTGDPELLKASRSILKHLSECPSEHGILKVAQLSIGPTAKQYKAENLWDGNW